MLSIKKEDKSLLLEVLRLAELKKKKLYIVGGFLRDLMLKREKNNPDIDFCLKDGAIAFGRALAREIRAGFVVLDPEHGAARVVKKLKDKIYTLDFSDFRTDTLEEDLLHRDFVINTLALELKTAVSAELTPGSLIDLYGAKNDLRSKVIKIANKDSFDDDPLRILRAFSLSAIFNFKIDEGTIKLIRSKREKLSSVSGERIRDELFKILDCPRSFALVVLMDQLKVLKVFMPEIEIMRGVNQGPYHHLDVLKHSFEALRQLENIMAQNNNNAEITGYIDQILAGERKRRALIKLAILLHDIGKPKAKRRREGKTMFHGHERYGAIIAVDIAKRLKLANNEIDSLKKMVFWHLRPGYLADNELITPRAIFRYFRDTGIEGVSTLLLSIGDQRATRGRLTSLKSRQHHEKVMSSLIKVYFNKLKEKKLPRLITGDDLIKKFKLQPSPLIGAILSEIEESQAVGEIRTKEQAARKAEKIIKAFNSGKCSGNHQKSKKAG